MSRGSSFRSRPTYTHLGYSCKQLKICNDKIYVITMIYERITTQSYHGLNC